MGTVYELAAHDYFACAPRRLSGAGIAIGVVLAVLSGICGVVLWEFTDIDPQAVPETALCSLRWHIRRVIHIDLFFATLREADIQEVSAGATGWGSNARAAGWFPGGKAARTATGS